MRRAILVLLVAAPLAAAGSTASAAAPQTYGYGYGAKSGTGLAQAPTGFTGGQTTAADGEVVTVYVQNELLGTDAGSPQAWADMLTGLVHGPEIASLTVYIATLDRVTATCGQGALGCYGNNRLITIGQDLHGITARAVITHEYGHHIADNRDNAPWDAVDWGTKRWATYLGVCKRAASGELAPGDEGERYTVNPGEAFAEDYRLLNERRQGLPETFWGVVSDSLYPDQTALDLLALDATTPWTGNITSTIRSSLTTRSTGRGFTVATPLDGTIGITLTAPRGARLAVRLLDPATKQVLAEQSGTERVKHIGATVCGQRTLQVQVKRMAGAGAFSLAVSKP